MRCALLDDYQNVALKLADWSAVQSEVELVTFHEPLGLQEQAIRALKGFPIIVAMRERTAFPRAMFEALPDLRLLITTGMKNAAIDLKAAADHNVMVCGTELLPHPTAELTIGLMLELARKIGFENARMKAGLPWQTTLGVDLTGKTLGLIGLGKLGSRVAKVAQAFGMNVVAWSQNLTTERARDSGVTLATKDDLFATSDFVSIHVVLSERTRGLIGEPEFARMKPSAFLINTSRGPIVFEPALVDALRTGRIAGAALDVFDVEPLPISSVLRKLDNLILTPHLGYVTEDNYRVCYTQVVEDLRGYLDGKPVRVIAT